MISRRYFQLLLIMEMMTGPTPMGGVKSLFEYFDKGWVSAPKDLATRFKVTELDEEDEMVAITWYAKSLNQ